MVVDEILWLSSAVAVVDEILLSGNPITALETRLSRTSRALRCKARGSDSRTRGCLSKNSEVRTLQHATGSRQ